MGKCVEAVVGGGGGVLCWHGVAFLAWLVWWGVAVCCWLALVSRLTFVVASRAVLTWCAGEGGGLILPALAKSAPTLPSPPRHPVTARCAACWSAGEKSGLPPSGAGAHGFARARGEPSDNLCAQCAEDGLPLARARSEAVPAQISRAQQRTQPGQTINQATLPAACGGRLTMRMAVSKLRPCSLHRPSQPNTTNHVRCPCQPP